MTQHILPPLSVAPDRFRLLGDDLAEDTATGLVWPRSANLLGYPLPWEEALAAVAGLNRQTFLGHADWRMPNRRELRSLIDHGERQPALPKGHPFRDVFLGWYWSATSKAGQTAYAWNTHLEGGRTFYSRKDEFRLLWPVRGASRILPRTGQTRCHGADGRELACPGTGQDGETRTGAPWPEPRFAPTPGGVLDRLTGLEWTEPASTAPGEPLDWNGAMREGASHGAGWHLPDINELESLVDADRADPALPDAFAQALPHASKIGASKASTGDARTASTDDVDTGDADNGWPEGLWSSTTSGFDQGWAFVLYPRKGAVGVGFKPNREFSVWLARPAR